MPQVYSSATKVAPAAGDYADGDIISESATVGTAWEFPHMTQRAGQAGRLARAMVTTDSDAPDGVMRLHLFSAAPSAATEVDDNVAFTVADADIALYLGFIAFTAGIDVGGFRYYPSAFNLGFDYFCAANSLFGILVWAEAEAAEAAGMSVRVQLFGELIN